MGTDGVLYYDLAADRLYGNQGQDWFWSYLFDVNDEHGNETNR